MNLLPTVLTYRILCKCTQSSARYKTKCTVSPRGESLLSSDSTSSTAVVAPPHYVAGVSGGTAGGGGALRPNCGGQQFGCPLCLPPVGQKACRTLCLRCTSRVWLYSAASYANVAPQTAQEYGRSPEWERRWPSRDFLLCSQGEQP
ncbi:hypothetical protein SFRURICE_008261 [Spodoptera frugiperda]|nr:hypothetical protein SFRURICE_008261 [Spodoptera frugiperda]